MHLGEQPLSCFFPPYRHYPGLQPRSASQLGPHLVLHSSKNLKRGQTAFQDSRAAQLMCSSLWLRLIALGTQLPVCCKGDPVLNRCRSHFAWTQISACPNYVCLTYPGELAFVQRDLHTASSECYFWDARGPLHYKFCSREYLPTTMMPREHATA